MHTSLIDDFKVQQRFANQRYVVHVFVNFRDFPIVSAGYRDRCFITLYFTQIIELFDSITFFDKPFFNGYITNSFADVTQIERNDFVQM